MELNTDEKQSCVQALSEAGSPTELIRRSVRHDITAPLRPHKQAFAGQP